MLYGHQIVFKLPVIEDLTYTLKFFEVSSRVCSAVCGSQTERTNSFIAKSVVEADPYLSVCIQSQFNDYPL
jgi:hypothetical protein